MTARTARRTLAALASALACNAVGAAETLKTAFIDPLSGVERTHIGFRTDAVFDGKELALPSDCKMTRPQGV